MTDMNKAPNPNEFADRIAGFSDPSMGDERERDVILRAYTFGAIISTYVFFTLGVFFAVIGGGFWTVLLVFGSGVMGVVVSNYCKRAGVDYTMAMARVAPKRLYASYIVGALFAFAWVAAIAYHQSTGHPLIDAGLGSIFGSSSGDSSIVIGGVVGLVVAITVMTISRQRKLKQARLEAERAAEIEDEN